MMASSDAGFSVDGHLGTCDATPVGHPSSVSSVPDVSQKPDPVMVAEKKPQKKEKKSHMREAHVHAHPHRRPLRHHRRRRYGHRQKH